MTESDIADAELRHDMDSIALTFEMRIRRAMPADGSADEDFEDWRELFCEAFDNPSDERRLKAALTAFATLRPFLQNPSCGGRPRG